MKTIKTDFGKIKIEKITSSFRERIRVSAFDREGEKISGAECDLYREKDPVTFKWGKWRMGWGSTIAKTFPEIAPYFEVIRIGMELLKELEESK